MQCFQQIYGGHQISHEQKAGVGFGGLDPADEGASCEPKVSKVEEHPTDRENLKMTFEVVWLE